MPVSRRHPSCRRPRPQIVYRLSRRRSPQHPSEDRSTAACLQGIRTGLFPISNHAIPGASSRCRWPHRLPFRACPSGNSNCHQLGHPGRLACRELQPHLCPAVSVSARVPPQPQSRRLRPAPSPSPAISDGPSKISLPSLQVVEHRSAPSSAATARVQPAPPPFRRGVRPTKWHRSRAPL